MTDTPKQCKYCAEGLKPNENGEHWVVKSIIPAKINVYPCQKANRHDD